MIKALAKSFVFQAGLIPALLAWAIVGVTAAAVYFGLPQIQKSVVTHSQQTLIDEGYSQALAETAQADGRSISLAATDSDEENIRIQSLLEKTCGVFKVSFNDQMSPMVNAQVFADGASVSGVAAAAAAAAAVNDSAITDNEDIPENSVEPTASTGPSHLVAHYHNGTIRVEGALQDIKLIKAISNTLQRFGPIDIDIKPGSNPSNLDWGGNFLEAVAGVPDDATGKIIGSDLEGVQIIPLAEPEVAEPKIVEATPATTPTDRIEPTQEQSSAEKVSTETSEQTAEETTEIAPEPDQAPETTKTEAPVDQPNGPSLFEHITRFNSDLAQQSWFEAGESYIAESLSQQLDQLLAIMKDNPQALLRIVGNLDFSRPGAEGAQVGYYRGRAVQEYLVAKGIDQNRVSNQPLRPGYAYDEPTEIVFYISE